MRQRNGESSKPPETHTAIIGDPVTMWEKLAWDVDVFEDIQRSYPDERQPLAYAAINVCIAAWSLEKWVVSACKREARKEPGGFDVTEFRRVLKTAIPQQAMCAAIANTSKHAHYDESDWSGGAVAVDWEVGDEDSPSGWMLNHIDSTGRSRNLAFNSFMALRDNWWSHLVALGLATGVQTFPEWKQNKLRKIFGHIRHLPPT